MSIIGGVTVTGFIAPSTTGDTYAVIDPIYGIDGLRSVGNSIQRNNIPTQRRRHGMLVFQQDNNSYYKLLAPPWFNIDSDWEVVTLSSGSTTVNETVYSFSATTDSQVFFNSILPSTPTDITETKFFVNGVKYRYGSSFDYTITGGTSVIWTGPFNLDIYDDLCMIYF